MNSNRMRSVAMMMAGAALAATFTNRAMLAQPASAADSKEWPTYGHDPGGIRYSPLTQITPANVAQLKVAWVYHMRPEGLKPGTGADADPEGIPAAGRGGEGRGGRGRGGGSGLASGETTPLVINGIMYVSTPYGKAVALDPITGKELWAFALPAGSPSTRGVEYFSGDAKTTAQIVFGSTDGKLYSLDAKTGKPNPDFGDNGVVNLNTPEILQGLPGNDGLSSPPIMYKNLIIIGGRTQEGPALGPAGDVRAWDVHTGKLMLTCGSRFTY